MVVECDVRSVFVDAINSLEIFERHIDASMA